MDFLVEGEEVLSKFKGGLSCRRRLFFGNIILTNYRLIMESDLIQMNKGYKSEISRQYFTKLSINRITKNDTFLAKLVKQKLSDTLLHLDKVYQFPITGVLKKKAKKNQFIYDVTLVYKKKESIKKETIRIRIQPKRLKGFSYSNYIYYYESIFSKFNRILQMD